jgi:hypothetical protein
VLARLLTSSPHLNQQRSNRKEAMRAPNAMYGWVNVVRGGGKEGEGEEEMRCVAWW